MKLYLGFSVKRKMNCCVCGLANGYSSIDTPLGIHFIYGKKSMKISRTLMI